MANETTMSIEQAERVDHQLVRGIGIPALTANIISSTIGAGIFVNRLDTRRVTEIVGD